MKTTFWQKARFLVLLLLVVLITISSHPVIVDVSRSAGLESGTILSRYIIMVFAGLFLMCLNMKSMFKPKLIKTCWLIYAFLVIWYLITFATLESNAMMSDVRSIGICLVAIMIGWQLDLDERRFKTLLIAFAGMTLFVGLMQIMTNIGGFQILDQYQTDNKNSLGVMLSSCATVFFFMGINKERAGFVKMLWLALFILSLIVLLTIRARAATLATAMIVLYILYERYKGRNFVFYFIIGIFLIAAVIVLMPSVFKEYIFNSFVQHQEGDITSGRMERNSIAFQFLSEHFILGNLDQNVSMGQVHNYLLNRTVEFGFLFVIPILLLYMQLLIRTIVKTIKANNHDTQTIGFFLLLIPFIISMAEPTFPFGPGTATVFNFIVFGLSLRYADNKKYETPSNIQLRSAL